MSKERLLELRNIITHHNKAYYLYDAPEISDAEYDILFRELLALEQQYPEMYTLDSPALKVGTAPLSSFPTQKHRYRMYSLENAMNDEEFLNFFHNITNVSVASLATPSIVLEYKFDGLAIELVYRDGVLVEASTRGDGEFGELVTENIRTIKNIPLRLEGNYPEELVVYGEVLMLKEEFQKLNQQRQAKGEKEFANPRNAAAGSIRLLDSRQTAQRNLFFYAYDCRTEDKLSDIGLINAHTSRMDLIQSMGFQISPERKIVDPGTLHQAFEYYQSIIAKRSSLPFEIDGLVAKAILDETREELGYSERTPKWAIAWKFEAEETQTTLLDVEYEVGRTGALTPVAILEAVELAGVTISRASLHNFDYIAENDFRKGDIVIVKRAGDVIPFVVRPVIEKRPASAEKIVEPKQCPICGRMPERDKTALDEETRVLRCVNTSCRGSIKARLKYFVSKQGLDIDGFGDRLVDILFDQGFLGSPENSYIDSFAAVFKLKEHRDVLIAIDGFGEKSIETLLMQIDQKRNPTLSQFIQSLGIRNIGTVSSNKLAKKFIKLDEFFDVYDQYGLEFQKLTQIHHARNEIKALQLQKKALEHEPLPNDYEDLFSHNQKKDEKTIFSNYKKQLDQKIAQHRKIESGLVEELILGVNATEELVKFFSDERSQKELREIINAGVSVQDNKPRVTFDTTEFFGKRILVTGKSLNLPSRQMVKEFIIALGAYPMAGVTSNIDFLISCEKPGVEKIKKAKELGITILDEIDFINKVGYDILDLFTSEYHK
ncbi:MAG: NAD-dependent DNA ligase LigA [Brevinema sp.]